MGAFIQADTGRLQEVAATLDPAPVRAAATALPDAPACGDPLPGCQAFTAAVVATADQIRTFCEAAAAGIESYASAARFSAAMYQTANDNGQATFTDLTTGGA